MTDRAVAGIILAAGKGTRMKSRLPKVLHPLLGLPLLGHALQNLMTTGASPLVVVIGYGAEDVRAVFQAQGGELIFVEQKEQLGTGHAARQAASVLSSFVGDILLLPGDAPLLSSETLTRLLAVHRAAETPLTVLSTCLEDPARYGRIVRDPSGALERIVEAKDATSDILALREINSGVYAVDSAFLFQALEKLTNHNAQGEYYLTDIVAIAVEAGLRPSLCLHPKPEELAGVNDRHELAMAERTLHEAVKKKWMLSGVTLLQPETLRIESNVVLEPDVVLSAGVQLRGRTVVKRGCWLEPGVIVTDAVLEEGVFVGANAVISGITLLEGSRVPPLAAYSPEIKSP